jgi:serine/threonine protein kinase
MAPEVIQGVDYSTKADMWSLGIVGIEMIDGDPPHINAGSQMRQAWLIATSPAPEPHREIEVDEFRAAIVHCLQRDPDQRASAEELLLYPIFNTPHATRQEFTDFIWNLYAK